MFEGAGVSYELGKMLFQKASELYASYKGERARSLMQKAQAAYKNPFLVPFLGWKYPDKKLLSVAGHDYPIAVFPANETQLLAPESVLGRPILRTRQPDDRLLPGSAKYRALAHRLGLKSYDRPCFTMKRIRSDGTINIECELGSYLRALDTCDEFAWELFLQHDRLSGTTREDFAAFDRLLPFRSRLHSEVLDPVCDGSLRSAAVAISTLLAFHDERDIVFLVKRRSTTVAVHAGMVHVLPSFMFQPATGDLENEFSVIHNLYREYLEELFNRPELEAPEGDWQYFYGDPNLTYLLRLIADGVAQVYLTGVAVNLLNLRPEICLLLYIKDPGWYRHHRRNEIAGQRFQFNDEWMGIAQMASNAESAVSRIPYCRDDDRLLCDGRVSPSDLVPPGAAAFWLGKKVLDNLV
jgi:hypothetical protein